MSSMFSAEEILETIKMVSAENLDIRTVTLGINIRSCADSRPDKTLNNIEERIMEEGKNLHDKVDEVENRYGIPIVNRRISVSPVSDVIAPAVREGYKDVAVEAAKTLDNVAEEIGIDFVGGFSTRVEKGITESDGALLKNIPKSLSNTERVCSSINVATTNSGINMNAIKMAGEIIKETGEKTASEEGIGCAKLGIFSNAPPDNPFMPGATHGPGEASSSISVAISGPGVVKSVLEKEGGDLGELYELIKRTSFKIARSGELIGRKVANELDTDFNIVDLSLAPTPARGDSIAEIIEEMGIESCGAPGSTAALAILTDAVKKGGAMASSYVGGLSGSFIPVTEDSGMSNSIKKGSMSLEKLEAMSSVCSVGLDMVPIPGDTSAETISAIISDEISIGVINNKCTGVRLIPVEDKKAGDTVEFGGLLGSSPILDPSNFGSDKFVKRMGRIPSPINSLKN